MGQVFRKCNCKKDLTYSDILNIRFFIVSDDETPREEAWYDCPFCNSSLMTSLTEKKGVFMKGLKGSKRNEMLHNLIRLFIYLAKKNVFDAQKFEKFVHKHSLTPDEQQYVLGYVDHKMRLIEQVKKEEAREKDLQRLAKACVKFKVDPMSNDEIWLELVEDNKLTLEEQKVILVKTGFIEANISEEAQ
jgi:hypothetical protein